MFPFNFHRAGRKQPVCHTHIYYGKWVGGDPLSAFHWPLTPPLDHEVLQSPHKRETSPTSGQQQRVWQGVSKEQSALFNHGRHDGGGGGEERERMEAEAPVRWLAGACQKEECAGRAAGELRRLPCPAGSHVSGAPVHLNAKCKVASGQFWARSEKGGAGWHGTPSYASWVTEIKTNLERCLVNRASTPPLLLLLHHALPLPSIHPRSSSPTSFSTISSAHCSKPPPPNTHAAIHPQQGAFLLQQLHTFTPAHLFRSHIQRSDFSVVVCVDF